MNRIRIFLRNLRNLFALEFSERWHALDVRQDSFELLTSRRADHYEAAVDTRVEERLVSLAEQLQERSAHHEAAIDARVDERLATMDNRIADWSAAMDNRIADWSAATDNRITEWSAAAEKRQISYEAAVDQRVDERLTSLEEHLDQQFITGAKMLDNRFDSRAASTDARVDERLGGMDRHIDQRFHTLEQRTDQRMEAHERLVDGKLHSNRQDIVDRTDLLLQVFEQRLDTQRRNLNSLRESVASTVPAAPSAKPNTYQKTSQQKTSSSGNSNGPSSGAGSTESDAIARTRAVPALDEQSPQAQLVSFRRLAASSGTTLKPKLQPGDAALYTRILDWKKIAHEGLNHFTPDEQETVEYILSFISDPKEAEYTKQHLRRFIATLQRVPPAQKSSDRLLELGSLTHLAPAIRKFCGYSEVSCADVWESAEQVAQETMKQQNGPDSYQFELRNFNVERDPFPYPDNHFRVVLCCELIEHLQRDPMHMLWECNRVLDKDGFLLLTTPNIASARAIEGLLVGCSPYLLSQYNLKTPVDQHNREYAPYEIGVALAAAGFTVVELEAEDVWLRSNPAIIELLRQVDISTELRGDNIFALARKTSAPLERYPKELYIE